MFGSKNKPELPLVQVKEHATDTPTPSTEPSNTASRANAPIPTDAPGDDEGARLRYERDRFLAFAFCASDILMELDERHNVVFAAGAVSAFLGVTSESVAAQPLMNFVTAQSRPAIGELLLAIHDGRRLEPMKVRLNSATGPTPPMLAVGYRLSDLSNRIFVAFRMARSLEGEDVGNPHRRPGGLHDAESFAELAAGRMLASADHPNEQLTLIELDAAEGEFGEHLDQAAQNELKETIATCLRAKSVDGRSAGELDSGRYGVVHKRGMDVGELNARIEEAARAADPGGAGVTVRAASVDLVCDGVSEDDAAKALAYTIHEFCRAPGARLTMEKLTHGLTGLLETNARRMADVRHVISEDAFEIYFQPVVHLKSQRTSHFEVLSRFTSVQKGVPPYDFVHFAEEVNLISDFDLAVCHKAMAALAQRASTLDTWPIAVNISGRSFEDPVFQDGLLRLLEDNAEQRHNLLFELTESMAVADIHATNEFVQALRAAGHKVCLDDFGVGAAAFEYLRAIDIDFVKIDGSYVQSALENKKSSHFLRAIAGLCRDLGVATVAEMVEDEYCVKYLITAGIDYGQGFFFGRPDPKMVPTIPTAPIGMGARSSGASVGRG
ncbi:MAG: EAL domain-containing protein [Alphaproteobacteria bacterium]|nr:EAL domain-containing protein [Alphaproteobacteria bacterium]